MYINSASGNFIFTNVNFYGGRTTALYLSNGDLSSSVVVDSCTFQNHYGQVSGVVYFSSFTSSYVIIRNNLFVNNQPSTFPGTGQSGVISGTLQTPLAQLYNNTFTNNTVNGEISEKFPKNLVRTKNWNLFQENLDGKFELRNFWMSTDGLIFFAFTSGSYTTSISVYNSTFYNNNATAVNLQASAQIMNVYDIMVSSSNIPTQGNFPPKSHI